MNTHAVEDFAFQIICNINKNYSCCVLSIFFTEDYPHFVRSLELMDYLPLILFFFNKMHAPTQACTHAVVWFVFVLRGESSMSPRFENHELNRTERK